MHHALTVVCWYCFAVTQQESLDSTKNAVVGGIGEAIARNASYRKGDGRDLLRKLLQTPRRLTGLSESMAREVLRLPRDGEVPGEEDGR